MRFIITLALSILCASTANAQSFTVRSEIHTIIRENHQEDGRIKEVGSGSSILETTSVSPRSVRLKEDIKVGVVGAQYNLKAGDPLFGRFDDTVWTYCGYYKINTESRVTSGIASAVFTVGMSLLLDPTMDVGDIICLHDGDNDGVFDTAWESVQYANADAMVAFSLSKKTMENAVAYERIDPMEGIATPISITWSKVKSGASLKIEMRYGTKSINRKFIPAPAPGGAPEELNMMGVKFNIIGYDAVRDTLKVQIIDGFSNLYRNIEAVHTTTYSYY